MKFFLKSSIGWEVIKLWFLNFPPILLLFLETYAHFKMLHLLKQLSFSKTFSLLVPIPLCRLKIIYLLRHYLNFQFCCQSCDVIFLPNTFKIEKTKNIRLLFEYKVLPSCKLWAQTYKKCKSSSQSKISDVKLTRRDKFDCAFEKKKIKKNSYW